LSPYCSFLFFISVNGETPSQPFALFASSYLPYCLADSYGYLRRYWAFKNAWSIDNIPGMKIALKTAAEESIAPMKKWKGLSPPKDFQGSAAQGFTLVQLIFAMLFSASISAVLILFADDLLPGSLF